MRRRNDDTRKWARRLGIEETRLYEIIKLRRQFRQIIEESELSTKGRTKDFEAMSSRERKIKLGERKKLFALKRKARNSNTKRKILKEGKHFDDLIMDDEAPKPEDDINSLEFQVLVNDSDAKSQLDSHKLNEERAVLIKFIIVIGLYSQYAIEDPHNNHNPSKEQFAHASRKPFIILHPNSTLGQKPEVLAIQKDHYGFSCDHQLIFYGLILETTKPFLTNTNRIPALFLLIFAQNITYTSETTISVDSFIEFTFKAPEDLNKIMNKATDLRAQIKNAVDDKLAAQDIHSATKHIKKLLIRYAHLRIEFAIKRFIHVPRVMEAGIFGIDGSPLTQDDEEFEEEPAIEIEEMDTESNEQEEPPTKKAKTFYCDFCKKELSYDTNIEFLRHKRSHAT
ncbi:putative ATP-dependent RNA helicase DHX34 [Aphelenchoides bicaudatus]|nr:putative ATP-dependent RNA helicase DHX34 [Aphelenchoides bicaudatus]